TGPEPRRCATRSGGPAPRSSPTSARRSASANRRSKSSASTTPSRGTRAATKRCAVCTATCRRSASPTSGRRRTASGPRACPSYSPVTLGGHRYVHGLYGTRARATPPHGAVYVGAGIGASFIPLRLGERAQREVAIFELGVL